jgi:hypothetical protein
MSWFHLELTRHCSAGRKKSAVLAARAAYQVGEDQSPSGLLEEHFADSAHLANTYRLIDPTEKLTEGEMGRFSQPGDHYVTLQPELAFGQNWPGPDGLIDSAYHAQNQRLTLVV